MFSPGYSEDKTCPRKTFKLKRVTTSTVSMCDCASLLLQLSGKVDLDSSYIRTASTGLTPINDGYQRSQYYFILPSMQRMIQTIQYGPYGVHYRTTFVYAIRLP
ncbi:hypothetical protein RF11_13216 [Thelohanellus kitauei]|uniref:Uncharacterized protein n=1 Tax=Thelohanellus kitauei TaxID=669202 RepID=A0A0C2MNF0_THEKT|nr:hypothetical protein RF11_13216 [Thelohanellus kitauei]